MEAAVWFPAWQSLEIERLYLKRGVLMAYDDKYIKAFSTRPDIDEKIQVNITDNPNMVNWYIEFNLMLNPSSVSSRTMYVTDRKGFILETEISYIEDKNLIKIRPLERYEENQYYILNISENVCSAHNNNLKEKLHILFKIKKQQIANIKILPPNVSVPIPKHRKGYKKIRKRVESKSKVYLFEKEQDFDKEKLKSVPIKINPVFGAVGLVLVVAAVLINFKHLIIISAVIAVIGLIHIIYQIFAKETRSNILYNIGVSFFKRENYEMAKKFFNSALRANEDNEFAEYAVNKMSFYE